jgi:hypothetical protein
MTFNKNINQMLGWLKNATDETKTSQMQQRAELESKRQRILKGKAILHSIACVSEIREFSRYKAVPISGPLDNPDNKFGVWGRGVVICKGKLAYGTYNGLFTCGEYGEIRDYIFDAPNIERAFQCEYGWQEEKSVLSACLNAFDFGKQKSLELILEHLHRGESKGLLQTYKDERAIFSQNLR